MQDHETAKAVAACMRVADLEDPHVASDRWSCASCGEPVWLSHTLRNNLVKQFGDGNFDAICFQCHLALADDDAVSTLPHWQREELNGRGFDDETLDMVVSIVNQAKRKGLGVNELIQLIQRNRHDND